MQQVSLTQSVHGADPRKGFYKEKKRSASRADKKDVNKAARTSDPSLDNERARAEREERGPNGMIIKKARDEEKYKQ